MKIKHIVISIFCTLVLLTSGTFRADAVPQEQNPASIWCDYHSTSAFKSGVEYPNGACYDVYTHSYYDKDSRRTRTHRFTMRCPGR